ncbi:Hpt domain-containing protein [Roseovarius sp. S4756]|uniref:Hpt domain-containing protein n=1 Tax=Roseovarius maritimus TaxID=3342637 RepID=UPI003728DFC2
MIDWVRIAELRSEIGADDFAEVVELFLEEVEGEITKLKPGADAQTLESRLHFLKGSALNLGFTAFSDLCQKGESTAAGGHAGEVELSAIIASYHSARAEFLRGLPGLDAR